MKLKKVGCNKKEMNSNLVKSKEVVECRYCHAVGHIKSKCPKLLARSQTQNNSQNSTQNNTRQPPVKYTKPNLVVNTNIVDKKDEFPTLGAPRNFNQTSWNFASVMNKKEEVQSTSEDQLQENQRIINGHVMEILK